MEGHSGLPIIDYMVFCFRRYCSCLSVLSIEHGHVYLNRGSVSVLVLLLQDSSWQDMECMAGWLDAESDTARGLDWTHCGERLSLLSLYDFDCLCTASKGCALSFFVQYHNFLYHLSKGEEVGDGMYFLRSLVLAIRTPHLHNITEGNISMIIWNSLLFHCCNFRWIRHTKTAYLMSTTYKLC